MRTFGVEEELLLVDQVSGEPLAVARQALGHHAEALPEPGPQLEAELQQEMLEAITSPHSTLDGLAAEIVAARALADREARAAGARAVALASSPLPVRPHVTPKARYHEMMERFGLVARRSLVCGFHVHVSVTSPEEGVAVIDRMRSWLPSVLALSTNSPFFDSEDTGYSSYRTIAWSQWPCSGPSDIFGTIENYIEHEQRTLRTGVPMDAGMLYFDVRLSRNHPTVEVRVADVCLDPADTAVIAGLVRALVETAAREGALGLPPNPVPASSIRLASWRAAHSGVRGELVHPVTGSARPAAEVITALLEHIRPALDDIGDGPAVVAGVQRILRRGTGADHQRRAFRRTGRLAEVVADAVLATHAAQPRSPEPV
ncbi:carboxylate-amine ligase [Diaminobutyricimonas aerilata]|uniref:Putative glutamate--cysteine ligase 2 n=1 Tax=Diaminobutyricimonas aerilata TaxID=1162967 RepID=A0A2M9CI66_9MICO|nr:glutamate--cysteine ligase [Diaminobutyricimonas aerilata]PJJ71604.1 carboxylate-amine ligase [Diaminobutyricimonas aerilata]